MRDKSLHSQYLDRLGMQLALMMAYTGIIASQKRVLINSIRRTKMILVVVVLVFAIVYLVQRT